MLFRTWALRRAEGRESAPRDGPRREDAVQLLQPAHLSPDLVGHRASAPSAAAPSAHRAPLSDQFHARRSRSSIECRPACTMKTIGFYPPYKGAAMRIAPGAKAVLQRLIALGPDRAAFGFVENRFARDNIGGDALDAVIAAIATACVRLRSSLIATSKSKVPSTLRPRSPGTFS